MKIVISAYACHPDEGSEPGVGWAWLRAAVALAPVELFTRANNVAAIEGALREICPAYTVTVHGVDGGRLARRLKKHVPFGLYAYYTYWQWLVCRRVARKVVLAGPVCIHHLTFASDWLPVGIMLPALRDARRVVGPLGGATRMRAKHLRWLGARGALGEVARAVGSATGRKIAARQLRSADAVLALNTDTLRSLNSLGVTARLSPNAVIRAVPTITHPRPQTLVFSGRLLGWKGVRLLPRILEQLPEWSIDVLGDGPESGYLQQQARLPGLRGRLRLHGAVPREDALRLVASATVFIFPSFHDSSPWSVAEAAEMGVPVVCLDLGGPPELVPAGLRFAVDADSRDLPAALANAVLAAADAPRRPAATWTEERVISLLRQLYGVEDA